LEILKHFIFGMIRNNKCKLYKDMKN